MIDIPFWNYVDASRINQQANRFKAELIRRGEKAAGLNRMKQEILFYKRAYEDSSQNALWHYMVDYFDRRYTELVKEKLGTDTLDTQLAYSIRFYCMGSVGMTQEWVLNDNITSAETVVEMMFHSMPENLRNILF